MNTKEFNRNENKVVTVTKNAKIARNVASLTAMKMPSLVESNFKSTERYVKHLTLSLGISPSLKGFNFIKDALLLSFENPELLEYITKGLYPTIAEHYNTTSSRVERGIRHAVDVAYDAQTPTFVAYFTSRPTNSCFLATLLKFYLQ